jgi:hypothetical protein
MAVTSHVYPKAIDSINKKNISLTADTFKALLCTGSAATWGATQQAYQWVSDATANYTEVTGGGYARVTLAGLALATGTVPGTDKWTCTSPISWGSAVTITAASMFIFDSSIGAGVDSATPLICVVDFGGNVTSTAGAWTYTMDPTNGLALYTAS